jgi:hypothetical protein
MYISWLPQAHVRKLMADKAAVACRDGLARIDAAYVTGVALLE